VLGGIPVRNMNDSTRIRSITGISS